MTTQLEYEYGDLVRLMDMQSGDAKHERAATSTLDVIWVLYDQVLRIDPEDPASADRDRFMLSKGHGPQAYYSVLAAKGFFPVEWLESFGEFGSPLGNHPDRVLIPGVEISSGSLGHGFPIAVGATLALRAQGLTEPRVFCLVGDGELDEGSNHEAIAIAGRLGLGGLTVVVVDNDSSSLGWPGGLGKRFEIEGWKVSAVDGRDHRAIASALGSRHEAPHAVVAEVAA